MSQLDSKRPDRLRSRSGHFFAAQPAAVCVRQRLISEKVARSPAMPQPIKSPSREKGLQAAQFGTTDEGTPLAIMHAAMVNGALASVEEYGSQGRQGPQRTSGVDQPAAASKASCRDLTADGTFTRASPSRTTWFPTRQIQESLV
jgi:hypothetical protein